MGRILLAPMEGVVDASVRNLITQFGGVDQCVTEFVRVTDRVHPRHQFIRFAPEIESECKTPSGVPVAVQLLGSDPEQLAGNARKVSKMGVASIDLNFGCPSKTVNRHRGGAVLLDEPDLIHSIIKNVRAAVPEHVLVTAKMRLGNKDTSKAIENAVAIEEAGASELVIHARTKVDGYRPPAHWEWIARIKEHVDLNVVANGEVWTPGDYRRCREISQCDDVMIGRGLIARPELAMMIKAMNQGTNAEQADWSSIVMMLLKYFTLVEQKVMPKYVHGRIKQWLNMMKSQRPEAVELFEQVKQIRCLATLRTHLESHVK
jgi:tRNA-dihydrouridine synthase C